MGGAERQACALADALRAQGARVDVVAGLGPLGTAGHAARTAAAVLRGGHDVVHAHLLSAHAVAASLAATARGVPVVVKVGGGGASGDVSTSLGRPWGRAKVLGVGRLAAAFVSPTTECAAELAAAGVPPAKIRRIPNGVDLDRFRPFPGGRDPTPLVLYAGRLSPEKGIDVLLEAWPRVGGAARLLIAGDGPLRPLVEAAARDRAEISFAGPVPETAAFHRRAWAFALPSRHEGLPNALLEAMASGCAVVASRVGGVPDAIEDGLSGILVPPGDPDALAAGIREALARADAMGAAARRRAGAFEIRRTAAAYLDLYRELRSSRGRRGSAFAL